MRIPFHQGIFDMATSQQSHLEALASTSAPKVDEVALCQHLELRAVPKFHTDTPETDPAGIYGSLIPAEKRLVRKLDWIILPVLWIMVGTLYSWSSVNILQLTLTVALFYQYWFK